MLLKCEDVWTPPQLIKSVFLSLRYSYQYFKKLPSHFIVENYSEINGTSFAVFYLRKSISLTLLKIKDSNIPQWTQDKNTTGFIVSVRTSQEISRN